MVKRTRGHDTSRAKLETKEKNQGYTLLPTYMRPLYGRPIWPGITSRYNDSEQFSCTACLRVESIARKIHGQGNSLIDAFVHALTRVFIPTCCQQNASTHSAMKLPASSTAISFWSHDPCGQWLCCSCLTLIAHSSHRSLLTLRAIYQLAFRHG
jgi:hypothetical protein